MRESARWRVVSSKSSLAAASCFLAGPLSPRPPLPLTGQGELHPIPSCSSRPRLPSCAASQPVPRPARPQLVSPPGIAAALWAGGPAGLPQLSVISSHVFSLLRSTHIHLRSAPCRTPSFLKLTKYLKGIDKIHNTFTNLLHIFKFLYHGYNFQVERTKMMS
ncbi:hypothetical protein HD554DRAFT_373613 [Boletus coccyginus]|nr:hypothetical protein HD554DRAFT_373613 [Boletus coccyginus]